MKTPKILVAEDERDIRELITFSLELKGYDIVQAPNGEIAVQLAREVMPDIILLDVRMPKMTGYEACKVLKKDEGTKHIPIIFLSAKGQEAEIKQGTELGADAYFLKPFVPDELNEIVEQTLKKYNVI